MALRQSAYKSKVRVLRQVGGAANTSLVAFTTSLQTTWTNRQVCRGVQVQLKVVKLQCHLQFCPSADQRSVFNKYCLLKKTRFSSPSKANGAATQLEYSEGPLKGQQTNVKCLCLMHRLKLIQRICKNLQAAHKLCNHGVVRKMSI